VGRAYAYHTTAATDHVGFGAFIVSRSRIALEPYVAAGCCRDATLLYCASVHFLYSGTRDWYSASQRAQLIGCSVGIIVEYSSEPEFHSSLVQFFKYRDRSRTGLD
jgi:hypothetical protein